MLLEYDEAQFSRTFDSFDGKPAKYIIEFDASLTGVGILWFHRQRNQKFSKTVPHHTLTTLVRPFIIESGLLHLPG